MRVARLLSTVIIARTLSAGDFGLAAVVLTVYELVAVFTRNGIAARVIQARPDEVERVARTAHWLTWIICLGLMLVQALVALPFAHLYGAPSLALPIALMGLIYLATPLSIMQTVFMEREGRVGRIAFAGALQMITDNVLTVIFALAGLGMWAIVLPKLLVAPIWVVVNRTGHAWRAPPGFTLAGSREILSFSRHVLGSEMLTTLQANVDNLLVGYFLGVQALGVYYFAYNAGLGITLGLVTSFAVAVYPHLCEVRSDPASLTARYRESLRMLGLIVVPMIVAQVALAPFYVPIVGIEHYAFHNVSPDFYGDKRITSAATALNLGLQIASSCAGGAWISSESSVGRAQNPDVQTLCRAFFRGLIGGFQR